MFKFVVNAFAIDNNCWIWSGKLAMPMPRVVPSAFATILTRVPTAVTGFCTSSSNRISKHSGNHLLYSWRNMPWERVYLRYAQVGICSHGNFRVQNLDMVWAYSYLFTDTANTFNAESLKTLETPVQLVVRATPAQRCSIQPPRLLGDARSLAPPLWATDQPEGIIHTRSGPTCLIMSLSFLPEARPNVS